jgi:glycosyltransferase involved in cell wall biosynthesis
MQSNEPIVSVIVPCYNSERTIGYCLNAILSQRTSVPYDVIVVDSSLDQTPQIVSREFPSVRLIRLRRRTFAGAARNVGVRATQAQFCLMIDSDCIACPYLIERVMARHREGQYAAVGGSVRNGTPRSLSGWIGYLIEFKELMPSTPMRSEKNVPTGNSAYRREVFERYGYFDEDLWLTEDLLFNWKLYSAGESLLFDPAIEVTHLNRTGWRNVLLYQINLGRTSVTARKRGKGLGFRGGNMVLRYPILITLMPLVRVARATIWLATYDRKALLLFLIVWPMYLIAAAFWSFGFLLGVMDED